MRTTLSSFCILKTFLKLTRSQKKPTEGVETGKDVEPALGWVSDIFGSPGWEETLHAGAAHQPWLLQ